MSQWQRPLQGPKLTSPCMAEKTFLYETVEDCGQAVWTILMWMDQKAASLCDTSGSVLLANDATCLMDSSLIQWHRRGGAEGLQGSHGMQAAFPFEAIPGRGARQSHTWGEPMKGRGCLHAKGDAPPCKTQRFAPPHCYTTANQ